jgi:hypothetical protein
MSWHIDRHRDIRQDVPHDPRKVAELIADVEAQEERARDELARRVRAERHGTR